MNYERLGKSKRSVFLLRLSCARQMKKSDKCVASVTHWAQRDAFWLERTRMETKKWKRGKAEERSTEEKNGTRMKSEAFLTIKWPDCEAASPHGHRTIENRQEIGRSDRRFWGRERERCNDRLKMRMVWAVDSWRMQTLHYKAIRDTE